MELQFYNTRTGTREVLTPIDKTNVRLYVCGPTVYDRAHIGNARPAVVFDLLFRLLRLQYGVDHVQYVRNITDIDDKINARAAAMRQRDGQQEELLSVIRRITDETTRWYHDDMAAMNVLSPTTEPRATECIPEMVSMIESLIIKGHAYEADGHVLFSVESYANYGSLAGRNVEEMIAGARVEQAPFKRNAMDFVLWKPSSEDLPGWESPWGRGRPGWHIECSAMSLKWFGESFDIHGGGIDLAFPHHENEAAQSLCAHPNSEFAKMWMHNGLLLVEGKKMAKSLGNFVTVKDLIDRGVDGGTIRLTLLSTHYRQPLDWTERKLAEMGALLRRWRRLSEGVTATGPPHSSVVEALADDLNTPKAISALHAIAKEEDKMAFKASVEFLGLSLSSKPIANREDVKKIIETMLFARVQARQRREFDEADAIREKLRVAGVEIKDHSNGSEWRLADDFNFNTLVRASEEKW